MKSLRRLLTLCLVVGLVAILLVKCGDDSDEPTKYITRTHLIYAKYGTLSPVSQGMDGTLSSSNRSNQYILTLEDVSEEMLWYTEQPSRESGTETVRYFTAVWSTAYGEVAPNAVLDGYIGTNVSNDGFFLTLNAPQYDPNSNRLTFSVTLLDSTLDNKPETTLAIEKIKITILDNSAKDQTDDWSFAQVAPDARFEPTGTGGVYSLYLNDVCPETYYLGNAPNRRSYLYSVKAFVRNWQELFEGDPPNASMTTYSENGDLKAHILTLDSPEYDEDTHSVIYTARLLHGEIKAGETSYSPTLFIEGPLTSRSSNLAPSTYKVALSGTHTIQVENKCTQTIWFGSSGNCKTQKSPCPEFYAPPKASNVEIGSGEKIVFHVDVAWAGRFWPRTGCKFNDKGLCPNTGADCCDAGGCVNKDHQFAKGCFYSGNPPVLLIEPTFDAPSGNGPIDYFDTSMVDGYNVLMSIAAIANTYNPSPDPGMDPKYWCTTAGCNSSPECPEFLKDSKGNCWSPCQHAIRTGLPTAEQEKLCCTCSMTEPITCPESACDGHYGCSPYVKDTEGKQKYPPNMCCDPWGKLNNNRPWDQKYIEYIDDVKKACPEVYAWQFDDFKSTINCRKTNGQVDYKITICP